MFLGFYIGFSGVQLHAPDSPQGGLSQSSALLTWSTATWVQAELGYCIGYYLLLYIYILYHTRYLHVFIYIYIYTVYTNIYICHDIRICFCMLHHYVIHICTFTYLHIHTHTYIYICIYIYYVHCLPAECLTAEIAALGGTNWHCRPSELRALHGLPLELQEATRRLSAAQPLCCVPWAKKWRVAGDFMVFLGKIWGKYRNIWEHMGYLLDDLEE